MARVGKIDNVAKRLTMRVFSIRRMPHAVSTPPALRLKEFP
jgi:hypothetical protein